MTFKPKFNKSQQIIFERIKNKKGKWSKFSIPLFKDNKNAGFLKPITFDYLEDNNYNKNLIIELGKWREANSNWFDVFKVTPESTYNWLDKSVINQPDRLLFLVVTLTGTPIGHMGLFRGEADNFIRGRNDLLKGAMTIALKAMLDWAFADLKLEKLFLRVFSDNIKAIRFYEKCGFRAINKINLRKIKKSDTIRFVEFTDDKVNADRLFTVMSIQNPNNDKR